MAGRKLDNAAYLDADWKDEVESKNKIKNGHINVEFDNMSNQDAITKILAGSTVDVNGVIYVFDTDETIVGSALDGQVYVIVKAGATAELEFTATPPLGYDYLKKGHYDSNGYRYIFTYLKDGVDNTEKYIINSGPFCSGGSDLHTYGGDIYTGSGYFKGLLPIENLVVNNNDASREAGHEQVYSLVGSTPGTNYFILQGSVRLEIGGASTGEYAPIVLSFVTSSVLYVYFTKGTGAGNRYQFAFSSDGTIYAPGTSLPTGSDSCVIEGNIR